MWTDNASWISTVGENPQAVITVKDSSFTGINQNDKIEAVIEIRWDGTTKLEVENVYFYDVTNTYQNGCGCILVGSSVNMDHFSMKKVCAFNVKSTKSCFLNNKLNTMELTSVFSCETIKSDEPFIGLTNVKSNPALSNFNISSCKSNIGFKISSQCPMSFVNFQSNNFAESDLNIGAGISLNYSNFVQCNSTAIISNSNSNILCSYFVGAKSIKVSNSRLVFIECYFDFEHTSISGTISTTDCIFSGSGQPTNFDIFSLNLCVNVPYPEGSWNTPIPPSGSPAETPPRTMPEDCIINNEDNPKRKWKTIRRIYCFIACSSIVSCLFYNF